MQDCSNIIWAFLSHLHTVMINDWQSGLGVDSEIFLYELLLCSFSLVGDKNCSAKETLDGERQTLIVVMQGPSGAHAGDEGFSVRLLRAYVCPSASVFKPV